MLSNIKDLFRKRTSVTMSASFTSSVDALSFYAVRVPSSPFIPPHVSRDGALWAFDGEDARVHFS